MLSLKSHLLPSRQCVHGMHRGELNVLSSRHICSRPGLRARWRCVVYLHAWSTIYCILLLTQFTAFYAFCSRETLADTASSSPDSRNAAQTNTNENAASLQQESSPPKDDDYLGSNELISELLTDFGTKGGRQQARAEMYQRWQAYF